jgi:hypothetical protein
MAMGPETGSPILQPLGPRTRGPGGLIAVVVIGLLLAVLKPWAGFAPAGPGAGAGGSRAFGPAGTTSTAVAPSAAAPSPTPRDQAALARAAVNAECNQPSGWRLYDIDRWRGKPIHVWLAIEAVRAAGPLDPAIEVLPVVASTVDALGFCAPVVGSVPSPRSDGSVQIWRLSTPAGSGTATRTATSLPVQRVSPVLEPGVETALGGLYSAPRGAADGTGGWAPGTYVVSVDGWWFGAEVRLVADDELPASAPTQQP